MKNSKKFDFSTIVKKHIILKVEKIGYYLVGLGLIIGFALVIFDCFKLLFLFHQLEEDIISFVVKFLDKILISIIFLEIFYTVEVALLEEVTIKCIEPFILVGITALIRRLLILSFSISHTEPFNSEKIKYGILELLVVGALILALVSGLIILRKTKKI